MRIFKVALGRESKTKLSAFKVFTTRVDTLYGVSYLAISAEHENMKELLKHVPESQRSSVEEFVDRVQKLSKVFNCSVL